MCPSTELNDAHVKFAADVLRNLLRHIDDENVKRHNPFLVSHAWTDGPLMFLVYTAPPSDRTWGLVRDTRSRLSTVAHGQTWMRPSCTTFWSTSRKTSRPGPPANRESQTLFGGSAIRARTS